MRMLRLLRLTVALSVQQRLAHRADLAFSLLQTAVGMASGVSAVLLLFAQVDALAGWTRAEVIVLLGAYYVVSGLLRTFVEPNLDWFAERVVRGELDDKMLQPVPLLFAVSAGSCHPLAFAEVVLGVGVMITGAAGSGVTPGHAAACLLLLATGTTVAWASRTLLAAMAFWAPGLEPTVLYGAFWQLGRYPTAVYHPVVRALLTYVVPVAFVATFPAQALTRGASALLLAGGVAAAAAAVAVTRAVWGAGLKRYTSATS
jgi:ABC-2 type transport system permease protein